MPGRHTDTHGNVHEAAGVVDSGGRFVTRPEAEQPAGVLESRARLSVARSEMAILTTEAHIEEGFSSVRSSWATDHSGSKNDHVFWAKHSLDRATETHGEALEMVELLGDKKTPTMQPKLDETARQIEKLARWIDSADEKAKAATTRMLEYQEVFAARKAASTAFPDGSISHPVKHDDPRLNAGEVFDTIEAEDGQVFHRRRDGVYPNEPQAFRVQADRELGDEELSKLAKMLGSAYRKAGSNEGLEWPRQDTPFSFIVAADTSKGDAYQYLDRVEEDFSEYLVSGTPVAKTNRGQTPKGERFVDGFGENAPKIEIYYDDVETL